MAGTKWCCCVISLATHSQLDLPRQREWICDSERNGRHDFTCVQLEIESVCVLEAPCRRFTSWYIASKSTSSWQEWQSSLASRLMKVNALNRFCRKHGELTPYATRSFLDRLYSASSEDQETIVNEVYSDCWGKLREDYLRPKSIDKHVKNKAYESLAQGQRPLW